MCMCYKHHVPATGNTSTCVTETDGSYWSQVVGIGTLWDVVPDTGVSVGVSASVTGGTCVCVKPVPTAEVKPGCSGL